VLEALQNTAKYAEASSVSVTLAESNGSLMFEVRDDGCGFDPAATADGAGLTGMADRLDTVGGQANIESTPAHGTTVVGFVPIAELIRA
jgi:signal transduction histidine kinase